MNALYDDIQRVLDGNRDVPMDMGDQWAAAKYVWNEQSMKTHLVELREHVILIQFTLQVLQLYGLYLLSIIVSPTDAGGYTGSHVKTTGEYFKMLLNEL